MSVDEVLTAAHTSSLDLTQLWATVASMSLAFVLDYELLMIRTTVASMFLAFVLDYELVMIRIL